MRVRRRIHLHLRVHVDVHPPPAMYSRLSKSWLQDLRGFGIRGTAWAIGIGGVACRSHLSSLCSRATHLSPQKKYAYICIHIRIHTGNIVVMTFKDAKCYDIDSKHGQIQC